MAYAAVTSLIGTLHLHFLHSQPRFPLQHNKQMILCLHQNLCLLQEILDKSDYDYAAMKDLEAEMRDVLFKAEARIEMELSSIYVAKLGKGWKKHFRKGACRFRLDGIINEAVKQSDYLKKKLIEITKRSRITDVSLLGRMQRRIGLFLGSISSQLDLERDNITVSKLSKNTSKFDNKLIGCDEELMMILDQLTPQSGKQRRVVSIVGMGGIGKTTLARKVYDDPSITCHFDKRAWTTVSQEYNVGQILRCLIGCVFEASGDEQSKDQSQLAESLHKHLRCQRYLIVIDDIWSTNAWDSVQRCFPDDNNGSCILLTSRLKEVAEYASSGNSPIHMPFLDADESWNLYCEVFGKTEFLFDFEQIGRDIVKKCKGLPLAIVVVASLLSRTEEKVEKWMNVAESVIGDSNEACSRVLSLSYSQLPLHLKACFLYFGVFPEDYEIPVKKLVRLWVAEGFLRAVKDQNMEEAATECLQDLVDTSLVIVSRQSYNGKIKTIRIHDLLRDLCLREARRENLLNVIGNDYHSAVAGVEKLLFYKKNAQHSFEKACPWISIRPGCFNIRIRSKCFHCKFHSLHCIDYIDLSIEELCHFKLLRVVDVKLGFWNFGDDKVLYMPNLVHLRYLALSLNEKVGPLRLMLLENWNMQSFIVRGCSVILDSFEASRIWKMPLLRNFYVDRIPFSLEASEIVHGNIETISWLRPECCTNDLFSRIPNLKKLGIHGNIETILSWLRPECCTNDMFTRIPNLKKLGIQNLFLCDFVQLRQLEKLSIREWDLKRIISFSFLPNLKKLNLIRTLHLPWSDMKLIGMLPNLEVLKLIHACQGPEWETYEGGFRVLKRLVIKSTGLKYWNAVGAHFPVLQHLELSGCISLLEIPTGFADITTLALIHLNNCRHSVLASAKWIQDEQHSYGNHGFLVRSKYIRNQEK